MKDIIMIIDDDPTFNLIHRMILKKKYRDLEIEEFVSGTLALKFLKKNSDTCRFIIFLDINMPEMSGWEFLEKMKENPDSIYEVHMITVSINPKDKIRAGNHESVSSFTEKPFTSKRLKEINLFKAITSNRV